MARLFIDGSRSLPRATDLSLSDTRLHASSVLARPMFGARRARRRVLHCLGSLRSGSLTVGHDVVSLNDYAVGLGTADRVLPVA